MKHLNPAASLVPANASPSGEPLSTTDAEEWRCEECGGVDGDENVGRTRERKCACLCAWWS